MNLDVSEEEEAYLLSRQWGSFFYHPEDDPLHNRHMNTFWGELITKYSDVAIPSIEYIAGTADNVFKWSITNFCVKSEIRSYRKTKLILELL